MFSNGSHGIRVNNDHGSFIIDSNYINRSIVYKGSFPSGKETIAVNKKGVPIIAVRNGAAYIKKIVMQGDICKTIEMVFIEAKKGSNVYIKIFNETILSASGTHGLRVYKDDGTLAFDSNEEILRYGEIKKIRLKSIIEDAWSETKVSSLLPSGLDTLNYRADDYFGHPITGFIFSNKSVGNWVIINGSIVRYLIEVFIGGEYLSIIYTLATGITDDGYIFFMPDHNNLVDYDFWIPPDFGGSQRACIMKIFGSSNNATLLNKKS